MPELGRINVFYSYAHKDEAYRNLLVECLGGLREHGVISDWHDRKLIPGVDWSREITRNLEQSHIVLLLISPAFMQSEYSRGVEVKRALELHWERRCRIVPVILQRTPDWTVTEFGTFQALPRDAKPVSEWPDAQTAYADIADGIQNVCKDIVDWENPYRRAVVGDWIEHEQVTTAAGQRIVVQTRVEAIARDREAVTVAASGRTIGLGDAEDLEQSLRVPLEEPLEDNLQNLFAQLGQHFPPNVSFSRQETGRGEEKLFVGGKPYYCSCEGVRLLGDTMGDQLIFEGKTYRCIDVMAGNILGIAGVAIVPCGRPALMLVDVERCS